MIQVNEIYKLQKDVKALQDSVPEIPEVDLTSYYTRIETDNKINTKIAELVDSAPETLNTLNELSDALGNDPNFATTVATNIGNKADKVHKHHISDIDNLVIPEVDLDNYYTKPIIDNKYNELRDDIDHIGFVDQKIHPSKIEIKHDSMNLIYGKFKKEFEFKKDINGNIQKIINKTDNRSTIIEWS